MKITLSLLVLGALCMACSGSSGGGGSNSPQSAGAARKVDMNTARAMRGLFLTGSQVNLDVQRGKTGSTFMVYACDVTGFSTTPILAIQTSLVNVNFYDAQQVNCGLAVPNLVNLEVDTATQANIRMMLSTGNVSVTNVGQANLTLSIAPGSQYRFDVTAPQVNNIASCGAYSTTSLSAPLIRVRANQQANITCLADGNVSWIRDWLSEPDNVSVKVNNGNLL